MNAKNIRMCCVCRQKHQKDEMTRIVKFDGKLFVDKKQKSDGRGAYICCEECLQTMLKKRLLNRTFRQNISNLEYENLLKEWKSES